VIFQLKIRVARPICRFRACNCMGSIIASHLVLACKENPAALAFAGFGHPRSAPHHSVEILSLGLGVMYMWRAPNLSIPCVQLHGQHHCIPFGPRMQRKPGGISVCRFWAPAECPPSLRRNSHCGASLEPYSSTSVGAAPLKNA
jgi:hypothetical protein